MIQKMRFAISAVLSKSADKSGSNGSMSVYK